MLRDIPYEWRLSMKDDNGCCGKVSMCNLGVALGLVWGLTVLVLAYLGMWFDLALPIVDSFATLYKGLDTTYFGGIIGLLWGFFQGYVSGALIAKVYNYCSCKCPCKACKMDRKHH